jgi:hypothetical protein
VLGFYLFLDNLTFFFWDNLLNFLTLRYYYYVYPCPVETFRESNCFVVFLLTLFLDRDCIFKPVKYFCPRMAKG